MKKPIWLLEAELNGRDGPTEQGLHIDRKRSMVLGLVVVGHAGDGEKLYGEDVLRRSVRLFENAKINLGEPQLQWNGKRKPRALLDRFGGLRNVRYDPRRGIVADMLFNPKHPNAGPFTYFIEKDATTYSLVPDLHASVTRGKDGRPVVQSIHRVHAVNLLTDGEAPGGLLGTDTKSKADFDRRMADAMREYNARHFS